MSTAIAAPRAATRNTMSRILDNSDVAIAVVVVGIVVMMIVPLPPWLLDILLTANISAALAIVLATLYTTEPLQFSVFPSLLLVATLFRLALNISGTRLILLHGEAGEVISSFGAFVVGGNVVVGLIVFTILIVVQFVVITNGAGRVAEVAARFTLDAMPGKQMAIDADLNAGVITDEEATKRRETIAKEADFYGAMDGASKFVKGDAIAAVLIVLHQPHRRPLHRRLPAGDDLLRGDPALLAPHRRRGPGQPDPGAAHLHGHRHHRDPLGGRVEPGPGPRQPDRAPAARPVPGGDRRRRHGPGPGAAQAALLHHRRDHPARRVRSSRRAIREEEEARIQDAATAVATRPAEPENVTALLPLDPLELEIGYGLVPLVDADEGGDLLGRVAMVRRQMATELGLSLAPIRIRDNIQLGSHDYAVKIKGVEVARWSLMPGQLLAMNPGTADLPLDGLPTVEPSFGLPAVWIGEAQREQAEISGYTVVDPTSLVVTHLSEVIRRNAAELLGRQDVRALLDALKERLPAPVEELVPDLMTVGEVQRVLQTLLSEAVPIRDLVTILETLGDKAKLTKDVPILAEYCRQALSRAICGRFVDETGTLRAITLDPEVDREIAESVARTEDGTAVTMDPARAAALVDTLTEQVELAQAMGAAPIVLCSGATRRHLKALTAHSIPQLTVLSYHEILPSVRVEPIGLAALV